MAILRGTLIGFFIGVIPGGGAVISSLVSYAVEKKISKHPEEFGQGAIEGVAGPESANNAASSSSFIPLLTLGIPSNASIAMIFACLLIKGVKPGPFLIVEHPDVFWGVIASMYLGNIMLIILNLPLVGIWVQVLRVPYGIVGNSDWKTKPPAGARLASSQRSSSSPRLRWSSTSFTRTRHKTSPMLKSTARSKR